MLIRLHGGLPAGAVLEQVGAYPPRLGGTFPLLKPVGEDQLGKVVLRLGQEGVDEDFFFDHIFDHI